MPSCRDPWPVSAEGEPAGNVTSAIWSPRLGYNVALAMLGVDHITVGTAVTVHSPDGDRAARVVDVPFPGATSR